MGPFWPELDQMAGIMFNIHQPRVQASQIGLKPRSKPFRVKMEPHLSVIIMLSIKTTLKMIFKFA